MKHYKTLESRIDVGPGKFEKRLNVRTWINGRPGKFGIKNERRAFNKPRKLENIHSPWENIQNLINLGPAKNPK